MPVTLTMRRTNGIAALEAKIRGGFDPLMKAIAEFLVSETVLRFTDQTDPWGNAWAPLKRRVGTPLIDTGNLRGSISGKADNDSASVGIGAGYGIWHQFGSKDGTLPARPMLPVRWAGGPKVDLPNEWREEIRYLIGLHLFGRT